MSRIDELLQEHSLHSVRSDGSQMIALKMGQADSDAEWELLFIQKDGHVNSDGTLTLDTGEKAVLRKIYTDEKLQEAAARQDFVEWRPGVLEEQPGEQVLSLQTRLEKAEHDLQESRAQLEEAQKRIKDLASQRRKEHTSQQITLEEIDQRIRSTTEAIAERMPTETQKIIANQVGLGSGFYAQVGAQSHESFRLSLWLAIAGGCIFFITAAAATFISLLHGNAALITITGSIAAGVVEVFAAMNRLYNQASQQFANFQVYLDRINRSSICYAMISEEGFEKKTQEQRAEIIKIVDALLK